MNGSHLQTLEDDILARWKNRINDHLVGVLPKLFENATPFWPWQRLSWSTRESSRESVLKDLRFRPGMPTGFLEKAPSEREFRIIVNYGRKVVGCINAVFISNQVGLQQEIPLISRIQDLNATRAKVEQEMEVLCFHAFAGVFDPNGLEVPERAVVLNWQPDIGAWNYREGKDARWLWRLFFPHTDQECAQRVANCLSMSGSSLMMTSRICKACGVSEMQLEFICRNIPGARLFSDRNTRFLEIVSDS